MEVIVEVQAVDISKGESIFIPLHLVIGKVRQLKNSKRLYLYPSQERLQELITMQVKEKSNE